MRSVWEFVLVALVVTLTPGPATEWLSRPITGWARTAEAAGLDVPRATLAARWKRVRALRFGDEQPGEQGAAAAE